MVNKSTGLPECIQAAEDKIKDAGVQSLPLNIERVNRGSVSAEALASQTQDTLEWIMR